jgi:hypothetical protein
MLNQLSRKTVHQCAESSIKNITIIETEDAYTIYCKYFYLNIFNLKAALECIESAANPIDGFVHYINTCLNVVEVDTPIPNKYVIKKQNKL